MKYRVTIWSAGPMFFATHLAMYDGRFAKVKAYAHALYRNLLWGDRVTVFPLDGLPVARAVVDDKSVQRTSHTLSYDDKFLGF